MYSNGMDVKWKDSVRNASKMDRWDELMMHNVRRCIRQTRMR